MATNPNLGHYDMVLSISQNTINDQFKLLTKEKVSNDDPYGDEDPNVYINPKFQFLTNEDGNAILNQGDDDFETTLGKWKLAPGLIAEIAALTKEEEALDGEYDALDTRVDELSEKKPRDEPLIKRLTSEKKQKKIARNKKRTAIKAKKGAQGLIKKYSICIDAKMSAPQIKIIEGNYSELTFIISFTDGFLFNLKDDKIEKTSLKGATYAFKVAINKVKISSKEMAIGAQKVSKKNGITDSDFLIESLFLNFQNANITTPDDTNSNFPDSIGRSLKLSLASYFSSLKSKKSPYILGYAITKRAVKTQPAEFQPVIMQYSTSYSGKYNNATNKTEIDKEISSFNFLMQLTETENTESIRFLHSLLKLKHDPAVNAVLGINFNAFSDRYIYQIDQAILRQISGGYPNATLNGDRMHGVNKMSKYDLKDEISVTRTITPINNKELDITYDVRIAISFDYGFPLGKYLFATDSRYGIREGYKTPKNATLKFKLMADSIGKFSLERSYDNAIFGADDDYMYFTKGNSMSEKYKSAIESLVSFLEDIDMTKGFQRTLNEATFNQLHLEATDISNLDAKVILPAGQVFQYKNIHLFNKTQSDNDAVLFDATYSPNNSK